MNHDLSPVRAFVCSDVCVSVSLFPRTGKASERHDQSKGGGDWRGSTRPTRTRGTGPPVAVGPAYWVQVPGPGPQSSCAPAIDEGFGRISLQARPKTNQRQLPPVAALAVLPHTELSLGDLARTARRSITAPSALPACQACLPMR